MTLVQIIFKLFHCSLHPFYSVANSLFHVVVENDDISTRIIQVLTREKGGRVTFIPLNRVKVPDVSCPQSPDFVPLLKKLKYRADHRRAFEQVLSTFFFYLLSVGLCIFYWVPSLM